MELYKNYLDEIESRKKQSLKPKPIDDGSLLKEIISYIKDNNSEYRKDCLNYFIYNTLPGTTSAAEEKAIFLKKSSVIKFLLMKYQLILHSSYCHI